MSWKWLGIDGKGYANTIYISEFHPHIPTILGKVDFGSISYIDIEKVFIQNQTFKFGLAQTAPPKMTAMTIGWY